MTLRRHYDAGVATALTKFAASKLRSLVKVVQNGDASDLMLKGQRIGRMLHHSDNIVPQVTAVGIDNQFRGMGLGKKLYGDTMKQLGGRLNSDGMVSDSAERVWGSLSRNRGYSIGRKPTIRHPDNGKLMASMDGETPVFEGVLNHFAKQGAVDTLLQPHQQRVVDRIQRPDQPGLLVVHGLGSGKTLTSIAASEALDQPTDVVVPAALQGNYAKEVAKHTDGEGPQKDIQSLQNIAAKGTKLKKPTLVVDEAHRLRDSGSQSYQALVNSDASKRLLMTGSPFYNRPHDIASLINLTADRHVLPMDQKGFDQKYIAKERVGPGFWGALKGVAPGSREILNPARKAELQKTFAKWVDYHPSDATDFPTVKREDIRVKMTPQQLEHYDTLMNKAPPWVAYKIKNNLPPNKAEALQLNAFLSGQRQVSNSTAPFHGEGTAADPKIETAFQNLKSNFDANPNSKAVVYSNFLDAGLNPYKQRLQEAGIPFGEFTGGMTKNKRDDLVKQYNENKIRALLLSSAGGEGLDLKGTRLMQILEPHWNDEKLKQVEGRGVRYKSHEALPEADRNVLIQRYLATRPAKGLLERWGWKQPGGAVDEYLAQRSNEKEQLIDQFRKLLPQEAP